MATESRPPIVPADWEPPRRVSQEEYRRISQASSTRFEFRDGWMYPRFYPPGSHWAMAGGTLAHSDLTVALQIRLAIHLRGGPCHMYNQDVQLYVDEQDYYYPDAFVVCGGPRNPQLREQHDAVLVCEVLSPSTADDDQGIKRLRYQRLASLREYLLLDSRRYAATLYRRSGDDWTVHDLGAGATLNLSSIGLTLALDDLYVDVDLDPL
jgi:Uma2 family endonuclease